MSIESDVRLKLDWTFQLDKQGREVSTVMPVEFTWAQIELSKVTNGLVLFDVEGHTVTCSPGYLKAYRYPDKGHYM